MAEQHPGVSEYWFLKYYRVLVIEEPSGLKVVSVDVYAPQAPRALGGGSSTICIGDSRYCIVYTAVDRSILERVYGGLAERIRSASIVSIKAGERVETVNVRYVIEGDIGYKEAESLFYGSWRIIGCRPPGENELP